MRAAAMKTASAGRRLKSTTLSSASSIFLYRGAKKVPVRVNYSDWNEKNFNANRASLSYMSIDRSVMGSVAPF